MKNIHRINGNIYITNDEEIKEGDVVKIPCGVGKVKELNWKFGNNNPSYIVEDIFIYKLRYGQKEGELQINSFRYEDVNKIILTTDQDLIKDGVQAIDDEFLEWFVKNPSCEFVEVEHYNNQCRGECDICDNTCGNWYKIIIPKQETLEEVATKEGLYRASQHNFNQAQAGYNAKWFKRGAIFGYKLAQQQNKNLYSEQTVTEYAYYFESCYAQRPMQTPLKPSEWFEQFKKK